MIRISQLMDFPGLPTFETQTRFAVSSWYNLHALEGIIINPIQLKFSAAKTAEHEKT